jgi:predicted DNA-binding transcriptional regulator YafY
MKFERTLGILVSLLTRERLTAQSLADHWGVSVRTIYRDLRSLEEAGVPLTSASGPGGGIDLVEGFTLDRHLLKSEELDRLREALAGLARVLPDPSVQSGQQKLEGLAGGAAGSEIVYLDLDAWSSPDGMALLEPLVEACRRGRVCQATYRDGQGDQTERILEPQTLVWRGRWYLFAWCRLRGGFRLFRVASLSNLRPTGERVPRRPQSYQNTIKVAEHLAPRIPVTVRFSVAKAHLAPRSPRAVDRVTEADGRVRVTFELRPEDAFDFCARWGADLEVLAPEGLRCQFEDLARGLFELYGPRPSNP